MVPHFVNGLLSLHSAIAIEKFRVYITHFRSLSPAISGTTIAKSQDSRRLAAEFFGYRGHFGCLLASESSNAIALCHYTRTIGKSESEVYQGIWRVSDESVWIWRRRNNCSGVWFIWRTQENQGCLSSLFGHDAAHSAEVSVRPDHHGPHCCLTSTISAGSPPDPSPSAGLHRSGCKSPTSASRRTVGGPFVSYFHVPQGFL